MLRGAFACTRRGVFALRLAAMRGLARRGWDKGRAGMNDNSCIICGGTVVCADRVLPDHDVMVREGRIVAIEPTRSFEGELHVVSDTPYGAVPVVDARGAYVTPGLIDIRSSYLCGDAAPRSRGVCVGSPLFKADRVLVGQGVTTAFHLLSVSGARLFGIDAVDGFGGVEALADCLFRMRAGEERDHLMRHRVHLCVDFDALRLYERIERLLRSGEVDLLAFSNHEPVRGQYRDMLAVADAVRGCRSALDDEMRSVVLRQQRGGKLTYPQIAQLASVARERGATVASCGDDSEDKLALMDGLEATVSEFPANVGIARAARARGMHTLVSASSVLMGCGQPSGMNACEAAGAGAIDLLCGDCCPEVLLDAVFALRDVCGVGLARAFSLASINPAKAAGIADEVGSLAVGKRADVLLVREIACGEAADGSASTMPVVTRAFVGGRSVFRTHYPCQPQGYGRRTADDPLLGRRRGASVLPACTFADRPAACAEGATA